MKNVIIVQARLGSTRLPGKALMKVLDKPLLEYLVKQLSRSVHAPITLIATTTSSLDNPIVEFCSKNSILYFRGSEEDVLKRYYEAAKSVQADNIVRITADCPLIDPLIIDQVIEKFINNLPNVSYVSNTIERSFPRGMDVEIFTFESLEEAHLNAKDLYEREHVTVAIRNKYQAQGKVKQVLYKEDCSHYRWTIDTYEDFQLIRHFLETLYPHNPKFSLEDLIKTYRAHPEWETINSHIQQKHD